MRIAFVTQWFPPEPAPLSLAIADGLAAHGHHVDVITGFPNYPSGRLHSGYRRQWRAPEQRANVVVHRAPLYPSHGRSAAGRAANYLTFAASSALVGRIRLTRPDVWLTYSSPATAAAAALTAPPRLRAPSCLMVQDLWPDSVIDSGFLTPGVARAVERTVGSGCAAAYRRSAAIGVISPGMREVLISRGVPARKIFYTPNWFEGSTGSGAGAVAQVSRHRLGLPDGRLFMYAGNVGELQGLRPLVEAFGSCPDATLAIVGAGVALPELRELVRTQGLRNVLFLPAQPADRIGQFVAACDVSVISLRDTPLLRATMPSKVQSSLAAGKPILAHAAGDVAEVIRAAGAGLVVPPGDRTATVAAVRSLAQASRDVLSVMGSRARQCHAREFAPQVCLQRLEEMLTAAAEGRVGLSREPCGRPGPARLTLPAQAGARGAAGVPASGPSALRITRRTR